MPKRGGKLLGGRRPGQLDHHAIEIRADSMHELSIALSMIEQIAEETGKQGGGKVEAVYLRIGVLSGVDAEALRFAYQIASADTPFAASRLEIELLPLRVYCPQCASTHSPEGTEVFCPRCITAPQQVLQGRELEVAALEIVS